MVTLHLLQLLANEGFGTIDTDLFWEEAPLDSKGDPINGVWLVTRGSEVTRLNVGIQAFDIYARYSNKLTTHTKLEAILTYLREAYGEVCELPDVPGYSASQYTQVMIEPTSSVENVGSDENEKIVKVISGIIHYKKGS